MNFALFTSSILCLLFAYFQYTWFKKWKRDYLEKYNLNKLDLGALNLRIQFIGIIIIAIIASIILFFKSIL
jgi:hypothetical protein